MRVSDEPLINQARERFALQDYYGAIHLLVTARRPEKNDLLLVLDDLHGRPLRCALAVVVPSLTERRPVEVKLLVRQQLLELAPDGQDRAVFVLRLSGDQPGERLDDSPLVVAARDSLEVVRTQQVQQHVPQLLGLGILDAVDERDFYAMKSLHYEKLKGDREGQHSMRLNDQWRLILKVATNDEGKRVVILSITDYH